MKTIKSKGLKTLSLVFAVLLLCPILMGAAGVEPTNDFYVNDFADVLSDETESQIMSSAVKTQRETGAQVVVLTVDNLDGEDIQEYSVDVFRAWGIGEKDEDNGVLILLSVSDRQMWVTTGYGVEGTLTDIKLGQLRDTYALPYYKDDNFDEGTLLLFQNIINELRVNEYGIEPIGEYVELDINDYEQEEEIESSDYLFAFLPFILVGFIFLSQRIKMAYYKLYDKKHGTNKAVVYREKIKARRKAASQGNDDNHHTGGFYGGFYGGGSSGGGGGGFSGGGGSTGGGGAGGSF